MSKIRIEIDLEEVKKAISEVYDNKKEVILRVTEKNSRSAGKRVRSRVAWVPAFILIGTLACTPLMSWLQNLQQFPNLQQFSFVCFTVAAVILTCAFHYFSVGNTIYSCAASLDDQALLDTAYSVTTLALFIAAGGFMLIASGILPFIIIIPPIMRKVLIWAGVIASPSVFITAFALQMKYSRWYQRLYRNRK